MDGILGIEGFETDYTASMWENWETDPVFYEPTITAGAARSGNRGFNCRGTGNLSHESWLWTPKTHVIIGFAFRNASNPNGDNGILEIRGPGDVTHCGMFINGQRCLGITWQGGGIDYTNFSLDLDTWYYIEFRAKIHDSTGELEVRVNGAESGEQHLLRTGIDTAGGGAAVNKFANQFRMGRLSGFLTNGGDYWFDDIYVRDNETGLGFLGDVEVVGYGLQDDFLIEMVRNQGAKNYENVIETTPDEDTTYVETDVAARDLYVVGDTAYQGEILAVQLVSRARKTTTHLWRYRNTMQVSGVDQNGPWHYLGFPNYETLPPDVFGNAPGGLPWNVSRFNAMVVGPEAEPVDVVP